MSRYVSIEWFRLLNDVPTLEMRPLRIPVAALPTREPATGARGPRRKRETMTPLLRDARALRLVRRPR